MLLTMQTGAAACTEPAWRHWAVACCLHSIRQTGPLSLASCCPQRFVRDCKANETHHRGTLPRIALRRETCLIFKLLPASWARAREISPASRHTRPLDIAAHCNVLHVSSAWKLDERTAALIFVCRLAGALACGYEMAGALTQIPRASSHISQPACFSSDKVVNFLPELD